MGDLLIAKLHACELSFKTVTFLNSYLKERKQNPKIKNVCSMFLTVPSGYLKGMFWVRYLFLFLTKSELHNFADDNTITDFRRCSKHVRNSLD